MSTRLAAAMALLCLIGCSDNQRGEPPAGATTPAEHPEPSAVTSTAEESTPPDMLAFAGIYERRGVRIRRPEAGPGYVLFTPMASSLTYLVDRDGQVVHAWAGTDAGGSDYLTDDGHLVHGIRVPVVPRFGGGGQGGRIEKLTFDGETVWSFEFADDDLLLHHDFALMPNGNVLAIAWEHRTAEEAAAAGRAPERIPRDGLWPDVILEIEPGETGGRIVWEWRTWDHMIQHRDPDLPNFGDPRDHPHRIDINAGESPEPTTEAEIARQKAIKREAPNITVANWGADIHHSNGIDYNPALDQIVVSVRELSEIWIIDHGIRTEAARGPAGDLLYRWGNPENYGHASPDFTGLQHQHDVRWIPAGYPGAGNLMAFSNETRGARPPRSQVVEFAPPLSTEGRYRLVPGAPFDPAEPEWTWSDGFFSPFISGAHRLTNGNTFINFGPQGRFVEVTSEGEIVWEYWSPFSGDVRLPDGSLPQPAAPFMYAAFRATFIPADHPGLSGRELTPLDPQPVPSPLREDELAPFR